MTVIAETTAQVLVDDTITLPLETEKIDEIVAGIQDLNCFVIDNKVIFQGILHKQIFFVGLDDGIVHHVGAGIPFSGFVDLPGVPAGSSCQLTPRIVFLNFRLLSPTQLRQSVVIDIDIAVTGLSSNAITFTNTLPPRPLRFGEPNTARFA
ncbi:MAG: DUF3794 domain-containing protein [Firmicutes bacterium]|nr:DUF3794 domain-containing protein [Bacillota bacterium]